MDMGAPQSSMGVRKSIRVDLLATLFRDTDVVELQWAQALSLARDVRSLSPRGSGWSRPYLTSWRPPSVYQG